MPGRQNSGHIGRRQTACLQCGSSYELQGCLQTPTYLHTRYTCALPTFGLVLFQLPPTWKPFATLSTVKTDHLQCLVHARVLNRLWTWLSLAEEWADNSKQNFRQWKGVILVQNTNFSPSWPVTPPQSLSKSAFLFDVNLDIFETM